jgi:hypothetical protein
MAEVLIRYTDRVRDDEGTLYSAQVCGGVDADGLWEGWIEFVGPTDLAVRTPRETQQPNRDALVYWSRGLTEAYLEGALRRALDALVRHEANVSSVEPSIFGGPATREHAAPPRRAHPILDPFATYAQGEDVLRQQLSALSRDHLQTLIDAYGLRVDAPASATEPELVAGIVRAVRGT